MSVSGSVRGEQVKKEDLGARIIKLSGLSDRQAARSQDQHFAGLAKQLHCRRVLANDFRRLVRDGLAKLEFIACVRGCECAWVRDRHRE